MVHEEKAEHNNPLPKEDESPYLYSHRKMTNGQKADIEYGIGGLRTHKIMDTLGRWSR
jgi:hypothetical protein